MKKRILTVLVAILTAIPFVLITPKADTPTATTTTYGSYIVTTESVTGDGISIGLGNLGINVPFTTASVVYFRYEFNGAKTGSMTIRVTSYGNFYLRDCVFGLEGATVSNMPSLNVASNNKEFRITFTDTEYIYFSLAIPYATQFVNISNPITLVNVNIQDGVDLNDIDHTLDMYMPGMSTNLSNIYNSLGYTATNTLKNDINIIKNAVDGLEGYTDQIEPYLNQLINYIQVRDSVDIPIYSRFAYINLLRFGELSDQYNYPYSNVEYGFFPTILTSNYSTPTYNSDYDIDIPSGKTLHFIYTISYWANIFDFIDSNSDSVNPIVTMIEGNNYYRSYDITYTNNTTGRIFVNISMTRNVNRPVIPLYLGVTVPQDVAMLFNMDFDNTYTRLLQQISNGVNGVYDTSEYEQLDQVIDNLNDNLLVDVNNSKDNILTDISNQTGIGSGLQLNNVRTAVNGFYNDLTTIFPSIKYLVIFGMIILVLGVMF